MPHPMTAHPRTEEQLRPEMAELADRDAVTARVQAAARRTAITEETLGVLGEIDTVLKRNAEEFMATWRQRRGE